MVFDDCTTILQASREKKRLFFCFTILIITLLVLSLDSLHGHQPINSLIQTTVAAAAFPFKRRDSRSRSSRR